MDIMNSIFSKLQIRAKSHFALAIEYSLGARSSRISLLRPETKIIAVIRMPNSDHLRCVFRFAFIPKEVEGLWLEDPRALDYFYQQCTADVVRGRYAFELRYEACIRLAALHMQQVAVESNLLKENGTVSLTRLEADPFACFLPAIIIWHSFFSLRASDASVSLRVRYLDLLSHLPSFGGRGFSVTFKESQIDMIMQIDPKGGLLVRHPGKGGRPTISIDYDLIDHLVVRRDSEIASLISIRLKSSPDQSLDLTSDPPPYDLANSFAEPTEEKDRKPEPNRSPKSDRSKSPPPSRRNSDVAKKLLKATDSLLTKNCQKLQHQLGCWSQFPTPPMQMIHHGTARSGVPNLESLILLYQDANGGGAVKNDKNGVSKVQSKDNGSDRTPTVAPMASIEEEMTISQITAAS
ncbi:unnamed protein product [Nippostrongylus brasiliensis]|uniref:FERM domain-containing protein n=1 Tax=Nippostrongylus brasiliensis TaxID=27835 RepID=A0A0N4Y772_NIPBR|nr:unnamed protein product [Nippostrongylus brasiliensis]